MNKNCIICGGDKNTEGPRSNHYVCEPCRLFRNCKVCGVSRNTVGYPNKSEHDTCEPCRLTAKFKDRDCFKINIYQCSSCGQQKNICDVQDISKNSTGFVKIKCKQCCRSKIIKGKETLRSYSKFLDNMMRLNTRTLNTNSQKEIRYELNPEIISAKFNEQDGICSFSLQTMTHIVCESDTMNTKQPDNAIIELIDISKGYVNNNIRLICRSYYRKVFSPGFIIENNSNDWKFIGTEVLLYRPIRNYSDHSYHPYQKSPNHPKLNNPKIEEIEDIEDIEEIEEKSDTDSDMTSDTTSDTCSANESKTFSMIPYSIYLNNQGCYEKDIMANYDEQYIINSSQTMEN